jgi:uncharacterized membrane protein YkvA (DUF1232 family)
MMMGEQMPKKPSWDKVKDSRSFAKAKNKAVEYAKNPAKLFGLVESAAKKAESRKGPLADVRTFLTACFRMLRAYAKGEYTNIPWQSLILIIASIIYFVMPVDLIPDFLPGFGLIDDAALLGWTLKAVKSSIDDFREWEARKARGADVEK